MDDLARLGMLVTCALAVYVGARTLWIWRSTRKVAELAIGINILSIAIGALILTAIGSLTDPTRDVAAAPRLLGQLGLAIHIVALFAGTWKIFRPEDAWARALVAAGSAGVVVWMGLSAVRYEPHSTTAVLYQVLRGVGMAWAAFECFRYSAMLRRRAAIGLGEPLIAHRIWLWGIGALLALVVVGFDLASWIGAGTSLATTPGGLHAMSLLGLSGTVSIALAFFPPRFYVHLVVGNEAPAASRESA